MLAGLRTGSVDHVDVSERTGFGGWLWRLTHWRMLRAQRQAERERQRQRRDQLFTERTLVWQQLREQAQDAVAMPDQLSALVREYRVQLEKDLVEQVLSEDGWDTVSLGDDPQIRALHQQFEQTISAHPNLPLDLLFRDLPITEHTVTGFWRNPVCPLLFLERPDFLCALGPSTHRQLALEVIRHEQAPRNFILSLTPIEDPWISLEIETHIAYVLSDSEAAHSPPDLLWLDQQVLNLLQKESYPTRRLLYALAWHRLIPETAARQVMASSRKADFRTPFVSPYYQALKAGLIIHWRITHSWSGIFYLTMRCAPWELVQRMLRSRGCFPAQFGQFPDQVHMARWLTELPFLARLGCALRLKDSQPEHRELRLLLLNDTNRYVRAAARKEIAWPEQAS